MALPNYGEIVKVGTFLYDGTVECDICIVKTDTRHGRGPEEWGDEQGEFYDLWYGSSVERGVYNSLVEGLSALADAVSEAEQATSGTVKWKT